MLDSPPSPLAPGDVVLDRYRAVEHIASGGHSVVFLGRDERLARPVCIKAFTRYPGDPGISQTSYEHFVQEAFALSRLTHPNTLRIYDFGHLVGDPAHDDDRIPFHVSEYMNGGTLAQLVRERGAQPASEVVRITVAVADALAEAHSLGIIHRDLKPQNILFAALGGTRLPKLADFGIAKWLEDGDGAGGDAGGGRAGDTQVVSGQKMAMYSPSWAAPEQLAGQGVGPPADIYSLALMAIYMLTGRAVFADDDVYEGYRRRKTAASFVRAALDPLDLPAAVVALLVDATAFEPADRPQEAGGFGVALAEALADDEPVTATAGPHRLATAPVAMLAPEPASPPAPAPAVVERIEPPARAASRGARRVTVAPGVIEVAGRAARFAPLERGHVDVSGLGGRARLRVTFLPAVAGRRQLHVKGLSTFVAPQGGRPSVAVQLDDDAVLELVDPASAAVGRVRFALGQPAAGHTVFRVGDEQVAIGSEECPDVVLVDFGPGAEAAFVYTPGVRPAAPGARKRRHP
ncbi:MAG: serine/threonine protein kinase [Kofleriaceae bacterium]|nr:serine/threonine protein kinase [Kofleriaceae bacterium]MCL4228533.1 serine/threonine protein kinase [Myxococcales bacterium]